MLTKMPSDVRTTRRALLRHADGDEDEEADAWDYATTAFIKKRRDATTPAQFRPIVAMNNLNMIWEFVLMDVAQPASEQLLDDVVFGVRPGRQTGEINFVISRLMAQANVTAPHPLLVGKLDLNKVFDTTDLQKTQAAATTFVGLAVARRLVGEHKRPAAPENPRNDRDDGGEPQGMYQGSASSPGLVTWLIEGDVWDPWTCQGNAEGWGIDIDGRRLLRMRWAGDTNTYVGNRDAIDQCGRIHDRRGRVWMATGPKWAISAPKGVDESKTFATTYRRGADNMAAEARVATAARTLRECCGLLHGRGGDAAAIASTAGSLEPHVLIQRRLHRGHKADHQTVHGPLDTHRRHYLPAFWRKGHETWGDYVARRARTTQTIEDKWKLSNCGELLARQSATWLWQ